VSGPPALSAEAPTAARPARTPELAATADAFEAIFLRQMIGAMRQTSLAEDEMGGSSMAPFTDMFDAAIADSMAKGGRFGIAEMLIGMAERAAGDAGDKANAKGGGQ